MILPDRGDHMNQKKAAEQER